MKARYTFILFLASLLTLGGCLNTANLKKDEFLLYNQKTKGNKQVSTDELEEFYRQKPNRRILNLPITPYLWIYYLAKKTYSKEKTEKKIAKVTRQYNDRIEANEGKTKKINRLRKRRDDKLDKLNLTLKEGNYLMRVVGEPPVIFDSTLARRTAEQMQAYLFSKGYFDGRAIYEFKLDTARKIANVTYRVTENEPYKLRQLTHLTDDRTIDSLLTANKKESLLKPNKNYDESIIDAEQDRIDKLMKENGYFNFNRQYVEFEVDSTVTDTIITPKDTTITDKIVDIETQINNPAQGSKHRVYTINEVNFITDASAKNRNKARDTSMYNNVRYMFYEDQYFKRVLDTKLLIHPGDKYSLTNAVKTQQLLGNLNMFKFVNINFDTTGNRFIANVFTSPLEKYQITDEVGLTVLQGLPGPFGNLTFRVRNIFGGLEMFETSARAGIEGQTSFSDPEKAYASVEIGVNSSLVFPQILFPGKARFMFNQYSPKTRLGIGYNFTDRPEYRRVNFKGAVTYTWQTGKFRSYSLSPIDVNYINTPRQAEAFEEYLKVQAAAGNNLQVSFQPAFVSSINGFYLYNDNILGQNNRARYFRLFLEAGGSTLNLLSNGMLDKLNGEKDTLQYFTFAKINPDFRYYIPTGKNQTLAFRVNSGIALPYGRSGKDRVLPYEKYFFIGGSNSIRAWRPRRLGPGAFVSRDSAGTPNYLYEQPGNFLLETSAEYRFKIVSFVNGAFFVDAGNVWTLDETAQRTGTKFRIKEFYKEIAVGTGFGLRFDFSFLILRLDAGIKVYDPARDPGDKYMLDKISFKDPFGTTDQMRLNIGIGYPF